MNPPGNWSRSRGITILELLIALGGLVVVAGLALSIYESTLKASGRMTTRQSAVDLALLAMSEITIALNESIPPTDLSDPTTLEVSFKSDRFSVPTYKDSPPEGIYSTKIGPDESGSGLVRIDKPLIPTRPESHARPHPLGNGSGELKPQLTFRYALDVEPGQPVNYVDELSPGQWPRVVEVKIRIDLTDRPDKPVILQSAVTPGRLPNRTSIGIGTVSPHPLGQQTFPPGGAKQN